MGRDLHIRDVDEKDHSALTNAAEKMGVSVNSIVKDAIDKWLDKTTHVPHIHDLLIYSDEKSMNNFLKSLDRMADKSQWFKSFVAPPNHHSEKIFSKLNWHNETVYPYKPKEVGELNYCGQIVEKLTKASEKQPLCCVDFVITDIANNSFSKAMEIERVYDSSRLPGLMFCPYSSKELMSSNITDMVELLTMHDRVFLVKGDDLFKLDISKESIHKIFLH